MKRFQEQRKFVLHISLCYNVMTLIGRNLENLSYEYKIYKTIKYKLACHCTF